MPHSYSTDLVKGAPEHSTASSSYIRGLDISWRRIMRRRILTGGDNYLLEPFEPRCQLRWEEWRQETESARRSTTLKTSISYAASGHCFALLGALGYSFTINCFPALITDYGFPTLPFIPTLSPMSQFILATALLLSFFLGIYAAKRSKISGEKRLEEIRKDMRKCAEEAECNQMEERILQMRAYRDDLGEHNRWNGAAIAILEQEAEAREEKRLIREGPVAALNWAYSQTIDDFLKKKQKGKEERGTVGKILTAVKQPFFKFLQSRKDQSEWLQPSEGAAFISPPEAMALSEFSETHGLIVETAESMLKKGGIARCMGWDQPQEGSSGTDKQPLCSEPQNP